jgi:very-short-patch-repair endonuclease
MPENIPDNPIAKMRRRVLRKDATPQEVILWSRLRNNQLGKKFRRQYTIGRYIIDFYCVEERLVIEIDGAQHFNEIAVQYDSARTTFLQQQDCRVLRFPNNEININIDGVLMRIMEELAK